MPKNRNGSQGLFASGSFPKKVTLHEVAPREGLQSNAKVLDSEVKTRMITELSDARLPRIECTGFFHPVKVPQLADASEVMKRITRRKGTRYLTHIPNQKGLERALQIGMDSVIICLSASDECARREDDDCNSSEDCLTNKLQALVREAQEAKVWVRIFLTNSWGCPYTGTVPPQKVEGICKTLVDYGVDEICLADNLAAATPADVDQLLTRVEKVVPREKLALHFHDNRGMGISNALTGLVRGVSVIDVAVGGLGGHANSCKYIPTNPVMLPTEDLVFLLNGMGIETGVDLEKASAAGRNIARVLESPILSRYGFAGPVERVP